MAAWRDEDEQEDDDEGEKQGGETREDCGETRQADEIKQEDEPCLDLLGPGEGEATGRGRAADASGGRRGGGRGSGRGRGEGGGGDGGERGLTLMGATCSRWACAREEAATSRSTAAARASAAASPPKKSPKPSRARAGRGLGLGLQLLLLLGLGLAPRQVVAVAARPSRLEARPRLALCIAGPVDRLPPVETIERARQAMEEILRPRRDGCARELRAGAPDRQSLDVFAVLGSRRALEGNFRFPGSLEDWVTDFAVFSENSRRGGLLAEFLSAHAGGGENSSGKLMAEYKALKGNFLSPLVSGIEGRNAYLVRDLHRCSELILRHEARQGAKYRYWSFARLDLRFLAPPPPLWLLEEADPRAIWIPDGQDWDGLNDRLAIVPRRSCDAYFRRWPKLLNGTMLPGLQWAAGNKPIELKFEGGPEWLLAASLYWFNARVRRFSPVAGIRCQAGSIRGVYGRCTKPAFPGDVSYKYSSEVSEAQGNALHMAHSGWRWTIGTAPVLSPDCFADAGHRRQCCSGGAGRVNGDVECWTDVYSYRRCCHARQEGVWLTPPPALARAALEDLALPDAEGRFVSRYCWPLVSAVAMCFEKSQLEELAAGRQSACPLEVP